MELCERIDQEHSRRNPPLWGARERANLKSGATLISRAQGDLHFGKVHKCLAENQIDAAFEKRANLLAKNVRAIDPPRRSFFAVDTQRTNASCYINIFAPRC